MRIKNLLFALLLVTAVTPSMAMAGKTCVEIFEDCLNATWNTSGLTRYLANLECAARYAGCIRQVVF